MLYVCTHHRGDCTTNARCLGKARRAATTTRKAASLIVGQVQGSPRVIIIAYRTSFLVQKQACCLPATRAPRRTSRPGDAANTSPPIAFRCLSINISSIDALYSFPIARCNLIIYYLKGPRCLRDFSRELVISRSTMRRDRNEIPWRFPPVPRNFGIFKIIFPKSIPEARSFSYLPACQISDDYFWRRRKSRGGPERKG